MSCERRRSVTEKAQLIKSVSMYEIQFLNARQNDILVGWQYTGCFTSCQNRCCQPSTSYLFPFHLFYAARDACYTSSEEITVIHHHIGAEEWWWCWHLSKSMQIWSLNSINCNEGASVNSNFSRLVTRLARLLYCRLAGLAVVHLICPSGWLPVESEEGKL